MAEQQNFNKYQNNRQQRKSRYSTEEKIYFTLRDIKTELSRINRIDIDEQTKELLKTTIENLDRVTKTLSLINESIMEIETSIKNLAKAIELIAKKLEIQEEIKQLLQ